MSECVLSIKENEKLEVNEKMTLFAPADNYLYFKTCDPSNIIASVGIWFKL